MMLTMEYYKAIVIGAGQAGLACAQQLASRGLQPGVDLIVIDANDGPGGAWRHRWDSLTLGKAHGIADLPGMKAPETTPDTPASQVVSDYYERYEQTFGLAVRRPRKVLSVTKQDQPEEGTKGRCGFILKLDNNSTLFAQVIINATGTWDSPFMPQIPGAETFKGQILHTTNFRSVEQFRGAKTIVVGAGLSAVQFLLELEKITDTVWATRRIPDFVDIDFDHHWGRNVEEAVRERTFAGYPPASVVSTTGIPPREEFLSAIDRGLLIARGMFNTITQTGVIFGHSDGEPTSFWEPLPEGTHIDADIIFFNTGFRHSLEHLRPLGIFSTRGGIEMADEVTTKADPHVLLAGYGSTASTRGATRAGRLAAKRAYDILFNDGGADEYPAGAST